MLGELHYIRAQWHRGNLPGNDSWQMPLPPGVKTRKEDPKADKLAKELKKFQQDLADAQKADEAGPERPSPWPRGCSPRRRPRWPTGDVEAEKFGYEAAPRSKTPPAALVYNCPPIEELIRWRLWDRTGAGLMAELGSHQLDAASIFIAAAHGGKMQHPLSVAAAGNRPLFPPDRDIEDHVYCIFEFPAPGYDPRDPQASQEEDRRAVRLDQRQWLRRLRRDRLRHRGHARSWSRRRTSCCTRWPTRTRKTRVVPSKKKGLTSWRRSRRATSAPRPSAGWPCWKPIGATPRSWSTGPGASATRPPRTSPAAGRVVALKDAVIALTANKAARKGLRIDFKESWFDPDNNDTPDGSKTV